MGWSQTQQRCERDLSQLYLPASLAFDFPYQHSLCGVFVFKNQACENEPS